MWVCVELLFNGYSIVRSYAPIEGHAYSVYDEQQKERFAGFDISNSEFYRTEQASPAEKTEEQIIWAYLTKGCNMDIIHLQHILQQLTVH